MAQKIGARDQMKAEQEVEVIMKSLARAGESAVATTLAAITQRLEANTPLMYHIHALLENDEWRGVLDASARGSTNPATSQQEKDAKAAEKKLRTTTKYFDHLKRRFPRLCKQYIKQYTIIF